jgi:hypothetical protein
MMPYRLNAVHHPCSRSISTSFSEEFRISFLLTVLSFIWAKPDDSRQPVKQAEFRFVCHWQEARNVLRSQGGETSIRNLEPNDKA